jgi:glycosyltransferase involved in cell wall biosynthesis
MKKIILYSNTSWSLYNFRKNLIKELIKKKNKIYIISNRDDTTKKLLKLGCIFYQIGLDRRGTSYLNEFKTLIKTFILIKKINPDYLFNFTIKPIVYGSLASRFLKIKTLNTLDGMGDTFKINTVKLYLLKKLLIISQQKIKLFYFVNENDKKFYLKNKFIKKNKIKVINGTGIDLSFFKFKKNVFKGKIKFLLIARLLYSKGIIEYLNSATEIRKLFPNKCEFIIAGKIEKQINDSIPKNLLENEVYKSQTKIFYNVTNIRKLINTTNCVILPTSYNEGLPRSLLEAAAIGRPIITTNISGCRKIAKNNFNSFLYNKKNPKELTQQIKKFILLRTKKKIAMSVNSYKVAKKFNEKKIISKYIKFINEH